MGAIASQITSLTIVYSTVYSDADQRKHQSSASLLGLCSGNSPATGEFPAQMASNAQNVSIWWRHHGPERFICIIVVCNPSGVKPRIFQCREYWCHVSSGHRQICYWLCRIRGSVSSMTKDINYLWHLSVVLRNDWSQLPEKSQPGEMIDNANTLPRFSTNESVRKELLINREFVFMHCRHVWGTNSTTLDQ